jgi:hypothetical protein
MQQNTSSSRWTRRLSLACGALAILWGYPFAPSIARAEESHAAPPDGGAAFAKSFASVRGRIALSSSPLADPTSGRAELIAATKEAGRGKLKRQDEGNWPLYFMAFLRQPPGGGAAVALVFSQGKPTNATSVVDLGLKPTQRVVASNVTLSPNQGFESGQSYRVQVVAQRNGKDTVLAETTLTLE